MSSRPTWFVACSSRPVESHSGAWENILAGPPNIFTGPLWGENFWILLFKMVHSGVYFINFWPTVGPPNVAGPGVANPLTPPSRRACVVGYLLFCKLCHSQRCWLTSKRVGLYHADCKSYILASVYVKNLGAW